MPEIPEMEIYKNYLNQWVKNKKITQVNVLRLQSINLESSVFRTEVINKRIIGVERQGKYLIFQLDDRNYLLAHMMLDGRLFYVRGEEVINRSIELQSSAEDLKELIKDLPGKPSVVFQLDDGSMLYFCNLTLGYLYYLGEDELEEKLRELGRDPLDPSFGAPDFARLLEGKRGKIKPWLMNPKNISGVGNAYSNEALFAAGLLPSRSIFTISSEERQTLFQSLVRIIKESIRLGGDMEEPFAVGDDFTGGYNAHFKVYGRAGEPCVICREPIRKTEVGGRMSYFCPHCQK